MQKDTPDVLSTEVQQMLNRIDMATKEDAPILAAFVASLAANDLWFDLSQLEKISEADRSSAMLFFDHCLKKGLSVDEQAAIHYRTSTCQVQPPSLLS